MRVARRLHSDLVLGPEAVGKHSQLLVAQRDLRKLAVDIQPDTSASHHDLHWLVIMGARRANDTYGSALKAHPGKSQGRPTTNTRSRRNVRDQPAQPCVRSRMPRGPDGRTVLTKPEALNSCNGPVMRRRWHLMPFIPDTNPIESSFATVKLRTRVTKGAGSNAAALAMAYKLLVTAQERWRRINGHELISEVLDGVKFKNGVKVTDDDATTQDEKAAA